MNLQQWQEKAAGEVSPNPPPPFLNKSGVTLGHEGKPNIKSEGTNQAFEKSSCCLTNSIEQSVVCIFYMGLWPIETKEPIAT